MDNDDRKPKPQPAGDRPPPRPPKLTAVALGPDGDDPESRSPATIRREATGEGKFIRQTGGRGQYGHVFLKVTPNGKNKGIEIVSDVTSDVLPKEYVASAIEGVRGGLEHQKMVDIVIRVTGGTYHDVDSSDIAFKMAGIFALQNAIKLAELIEVK